LLAASAELDARSWAIGVSGCFPGYQDSFRRFFLCRKGGGEKRKEKKKKKKKKRRRIIQCRITTLAPTSASLNLTPNLTSRFLRLSQTFRDGKKEKEEGKKGGEGRKTHWATTTTGLSHPEAFTSSRLIPLLYVRWERERRKGEGEKESKEGGSQKERVRRVDGRKPLVPAMVQNDRYRRRFPRGGEGGSKRGRGEGRNAFFAAWRSDPFFCDVESSPKNNLQFRSTISFREKKGEKGGGEKKGGKKKRKRGGGGKKRKVSKCGPAR